MQNHAKENLLFTFGVMKSATLAVASVVLYQLSAAVWRGDSYGKSRLVAWVASFFVAWLTYNNVSAMSNLTTYETKGIDIFFLFLKTPVEMLLFLVLQYEPGWYAWPLLYGAITGISHLKIRRFVQIMESEGYDPVLRPLLSRIIKDAKKGDLPGTLLSSLVFSSTSIAALVLFHLHVISSSVMGKFSLVASIVAFVPITVALATGDKIRGEILRALDENKGKSMAAGRVA
jgi:uncharacterized membrane protein